MFRAAQRDIVAIDLVTRGTAQDIAKIAHDIFGDPGKEFRAEFLIACRQASIAAALRPTLGAKADARETIRSPTPVLPDAPLLVAVNVTAFSWSP